MCTYACECAFMKAWGLCYLWVYRRRGQYYPTLENFYVNVKLSTGELGGKIKAKNDSVDHSGVENVEKAGFTGRLTCIF